MRTAHRNGFTLVELLVVIAILGILLSLMLPAIQAAREGARRVKCIHNLAQLGTALQSYETAYEVLPPGVVDDVGPVRSVPEGNHVSWLVQLLPYLQEKVVHEQIDFSVGAYDEENAAARSVPFAVLQCPSFLGLYELTGAWMSNYAGCHHDVEAPIDEDNHGAFFLNSHLRSREIPDGATHTIFLGEKLGGDKDLGWMSGTRATLRNAGTPLNETRWDETRNLGPADRGDPFDFGEPEPEPEPPKPDPEKEQLAVGGFGSDHVIVVNFLFGDGAVRSLDTHIDPGLLQQLGHRDDGQLLLEGPTRTEDR